MSVPLNNRSSFFFNNYLTSGEQQLVQSLNDEMISIHGIETYYVPRNLINYDSIYGADDQSTYTQAIPIVVYIETMYGFTGDGNFMSKFGLEIRDQIIFSVSIPMFNQEIGSQTTQSRPNEGDLIYLPFNKKCFQIKFTDPFEMFFQMQTVQTYRMTCELFEYSDETFNTGIPDIDIIQTKFTTNALDNALSNENNTLLVDQDSDVLDTQNADLKTKVENSDNEQFKSESSKTIDFNTDNPFGELP